MQNKRIRGQVNGTKQQPMKRTQRLSKGKREAAGRHDRKVLMEQAKKMLPETGTQFIRLGKVFVNLKEECDNNEQFKEMCEELRVSYRKAAYLISVYETARDMSIPTDVLSEIGWTKASILAPVLRPGNWKGWVNRAKKMNTVTLQQMIATGSTETRKLLALPVKETTHRAFLKCLDEMGVRHSGRAERWKKRDAALLKMIKAVRGEN